MRKKKKFRKLRPIEQFSEENYYTEFLGACIKHSKRDHSKYFKKYDPELPRVTAILGFLKSINPKSILDIGFGRGRLFWPIAFHMSEAKILGIDSEYHGIERVKKVSKEIKRIRGLCEDITTWNVKPNRFASEVLEHIPDVKKAIENIVLISKKYIVGSVPSRRDSNPDHLRLLTPQILNILFTEVCKEQDVKIKKIQFDYTLKELLFFIKLEK